MKVMPFASNKEDDDTLPSTNSKTSTLFPSGKTINNVKPLFKLNGASKTMNNDTIEELKIEAMKLFNQGKLSLEYLEIVDQNTLIYSNDHEKSNLVVCIAAYCNEIRLIDNMILS